MNIAEMLFSRKNKQKKIVKAGDIIEARIDGVALLYPFNRVQEALIEYGVKDGLSKIWDRDKVYYFQDHYQPPPNTLVAEQNRIGREIAHKLKFKYFYDTVCGVGHQQMMDFGFVRPGELIIGIDSHAVIYGALNAGGTGIGETDAAYALTFGELWFQVPHSIKIVLNGSARNYPFSKDIILYLAGEYGDDFAQYKSLEFTGTVAQEMNLSDRMCLSDHTIEVGGKFGFFEADEKTIEYVKKKTEKPFEIVEPDKNAEYERIIEVDVDNLDFYVAKPHHFGNVVPISEVVGQHIDQAVIGSCANGRFEDIEIAAKILKGKKIAPHVRFLISPASWEIYRQCMHHGLIDILLDAGAQFLEPGCGVCQPMKGVLTKGEVAITSTTRNYQGRYGSTEAYLFLAGPATVAASSLTGCITNPKEALDEL